MSRHERTSVFGERVLIGADPSIQKFGAPFRMVLSTGPSGIIEVGDDIGLNPCAIHALSRITIGKRVLVAAGVRVVDDDGGHLVDAIPRRYESGSKPEPVIIEDDVWLCIDVVVLKGVRIGKGSIVAARSVVTKDIPPYVLAAGMPAKVVRTLRIPKAADDVEKEINN